MTKKDYIAIAKIIGGAKVRANVMTGNETLYANTVVKELADYFKQDNPNFDRQRFYNAVHEEWDKDNG